MRFLTHIADLLERGRNAGGFLTESPPLANKIRQLIRIATTAGQALAPGKKSCYAPMERGFVALLDEQAGF
jgi:hypothetical protein